MGTVPVIRVKGMSRLQYDFKWDTASRHYAYEPNNQKEADDIFRTQGRLYRRMFFSVLMDEKKPEKEKKKPVKRKKVEKKVSTIEGMVRQSADIPLEKVEKKPQLQAVVAKDDE